MELSLSRPNTGYTARTQRRGELDLHAAEICTEQYVHFALRIVVCHSSSHLAVVRSKAIPRIQNV